MNPDFHVLIRKLNIGMPLAHADKWILSCSLVLLQDFLNTNPADAQARFGYHLLECMKTMSYIQDTPKQNKMES